jgi:hypothetical protein
MKRVVLGLVAIMISGTLSGKAHADCAGDIEAIRLKLPDIKEDARRQELEKLVDKAQRDADQGRMALCTDTVRHALVLLK